MKVFIPLSQGQVAKVDLVDYLEIKKMKWCAAKNKSKNSARFYAVSGGEKQVAMHRLILNAKKGQLVDHIDGDGLNNTRSNLRISDYSKNQANKHITVGKSRFKGVSYRDGLRKPWRCSIERRENNKRKYYHIGYFKTEHEAALAYNKKALELFGEHAFLNIL